MLYPVHSELTIIQPPSPTRWPNGRPLHSRRLARLQAANEILEHRLADLTARSETLQGELAAARIARSQCHERLAAMAKTVTELQRINTELNALWRADRQQILEQCAGMELGR